MKEMSELETSAVDSNISCCVYRYMTMILYPAGMEALSSHKY